ncbi:MAG: tetratricopeptide repeat protein [Hyphomicrobium sp.]
MRIGDLLSYRGDLSSALDRYQTSLAIADRLAESEPGHAERRCNLAISHQRIGHVLYAQGKLSAALDSYQTSLAVIDRIAMSDPRRDEWQHDLAMSYSTLAIRAQRGADDNALDWLRLDRAIIARTARSFPWQCNP